MAQVSITQLPSSTTLLGSELVPIVQSGVTVQTTTGAIANISSSTSKFTAPVTITADYTVGTTDFYLINNKVGSTLNLYLPAASLIPGRTLTIMNYQPQAVVAGIPSVVPQGGGAATTAIVPAGAGNWATLVSDGTNWITMQAAVYSNLLT
jgi:hypothetical protein